MGYRASWQSSTKHSPYYMLYQKKMRLPIHNEVPSQCEQDDVQDCTLTSFLRGCCSLEIRLFMQPKRTSKLPKRIKKKPTTGSTSLKYLKSGPMCCWKTQCRSRERGGNSSHFAYSIHRDLGPVGVVQQRWKDIEEESKHSKAKTLSALGPRISKGGK